MFLGMFKKTLSLWLDQELLLLLLNLLRTEPGCTVSRERL